MEMEWVLAHLRCRKQLHRHSRIRMFALLRALARTSVCERAFRALAQAGTFAVGWLCHSLVLSRSASLTLLRPRDLGVKCVLARGCVRRRCAGGLVVDETAVSIGANHRTRRQACAQGRAVVHRVFRTLEISRYTGCITEIAWKKFCAVACLLVVPV